MSLQIWNEHGILERESQVYILIKEKGIKVSFVTYGNARDKILAKEVIPEIGLYCNSWNLPMRIYTFLITKILPLYFYFTKVFFNRYVIIKSHQMKGSKVAHTAARIADIKFIMRCGYIYSKSIELIHGKDAPILVRARNYERQIVESADHCVVAAQFLKDEILNMYRIKEYNVSVIPNCVDTNVFSPEKNTNKINGRICYVGNYWPWKNLMNLLNSIKGLPVELILVGRDNMEGVLQKKADDEKLPVSFINNAHNREIPGILNKSVLFVLPSLHEGHPKALIEAMACGLPILGTNVRGIRNLIIDGETGLLCGTSASEIRAGIIKLINDYYLQTYLGQNARNHALKYFSCDNIMKMELDLLNGLCQGN